MSTKTLFRQLVDRLAKSRERKRRHRPRRRHMVVESLQDRCLLAGIAAVVPDPDLPGAEDVLVPGPLEADATPPRPIDGTLSPPDNGVQPPPNDGTQTPPDGGGMTIQQTLSDEAQKNTIAFDGLAFLTGSLGADSFLPPGKVADFWGFQYLRDNDPSEMGHNTDFLTKAANNVLSVLTDTQTAELVTLAESQVDAINQYAYDRFVLMDGFRSLLEGDLPEGSTGLDVEAVKAHSAQLYALDAQISIERAEVMGGILHAMDATQREHLDAMVGQGMTSWPDVGDQLDQRAYSHDVHVAVMTYAGDMFSWYSGSVEADVYFCPERQGTYFGSFYLKDAPAMGNPNYTIDSNLTAESGAAFLATLTTDQAQQVTDLVELQRDELNEIVEVREQVAIELRRYMTGDSVDTDAVLALMEQYGELDGEIVYQYANVFAAVGQSLTAEQEAALADLRAELGVSQPDGAYLYSEPIAMPTIVSSDFLFAGTTDDTQPPPDDDTQPPPDDDTQPPPDDDDTQPPPDDDTQPPPDDGTQPPPDDDTQPPPDDDDTQSPPDDDTQPPPDDDTQPPPDDDTQPPPDDGTKPPPDDNPLPPPDDGTQPPCNEGPQPRRDDGPKPSPDRRGVTIERPLVNEAQGDTIPVRRAATNRQPRTTHIALRRIEATDAAFGRGDDLASLHDWDQLLRVPVWR